MATVRAPVGAIGIFSTATRITLPREVRRMPRKKILLFSADMIFMDDQAQIPEDKQPIVSNSTKNIQGRTNPTITPIDDATRLLSNR